MIKASFYEDNERLRLTIDGHAGYRIGGADIVCAAVSGIFYALIGYLHNLKKNDFSINAVRDGYADIYCNKSCEEALKLTCIGLIQIEITYPGYVEVNNHLWNWRVRREA